ncbi:hypothetical protein H7I41_29870 [Mycobacterium manitobense]|uniref:DUF559 domain-containing protein n=1 Tax=[Mycobacterium] manitobense TaxID=190147 RepID=A0A9X3BQV6_9MYCO|nr:hypothetical protein [[Mycobacterium] manitobense]MCV7174134.1 hypothetical protein [[Mycobacterium] manitobense]
MDLQAVFSAQDGVATSAQILDHLTRRQLESRVKTGELNRLWQGVYCLGEPSDELRLRALDLTCGTAVPACLGTAAALYGFDTEEPADLHVLSPPGCRLRSEDGLREHRRDGASIDVVAGRPATAAAWTAVEVARSLRRPRALATLDKALRSGTCGRAEVWRAAVQQAGRRGIVAVRELIPVADPQAESPMESEARLAMLDGGLPVPELQWEVVDGNRERRRLDFAWPDRRVAVEYDGADWHSGPEAMRNDRRRAAALLDIRWTVIAIVSEDVRSRPWEFVGRVDAQLRRARAA